MKPATPTGGPSAADREAPTRVDEHGLTVALGSGHTGGAPLLEPGTRLGRYEIRALLGAGGMGRVYSALDATLDREVAIKALTHAFQADSGSLRRLEREAKVLAALSHPNIAAIYGFEELDGAQYLVLERVDGGTLGDRLDQGPLPIKEALALAIQVAEGLAEAHGKGVIHRDLKPSNVMLAGGGRVKLVDFGLAKDTARGRPSSAPSNLTTAVGTVVGTAPYMSPEQVRGEEVDSRTDVWAFGCLLYEMLTARPAFWGPTVPEVMAAVLRDEPRYDALPEVVPETLRRLLRRCLVKDLELRPQAIGDLRLELLEIRGELGRPLPTPAPASRWQRLRNRAPAAALIVLVSALGALGLGVLWERDAPARPTAAVALSLELPRGLTLVKGLAAPFALSPDGMSAVVVAKDGDHQRLYLRRFDEPTVRALAGTDDATQPFFAPDGHAVAYFADRKLMVVPVGGGPAESLGDLGSNARGGTWLGDGNLVVAPSQTSGLLRVPSDGSRPTPLTTLDPGPGERSHRWPEALPGGRWVLFSVGLEGTTFDDGRLDAVAIDTGERRQILSGAAYGRYASTGHLVFVRSGRVYAVPFDLATLRVQGKPEVVVDGVRYDPQNGSAHLALSPNGTLLYGAGLPLSSDTYLSWLTTDGRLTRASPTPRSFNDPRLSPAGDRVAVVVGGATASDLRVVDAGGTMTQLSFGVVPHRPIWTPDGRRVTIGAEANGRWRLVTLAAEGKGASQVLLDGLLRVYPCGWAPGGRTLVYQGHSPETGWDLYTLAVAADGRADGAPQAFAATPFHEANAAISPDGRFVAYESDELDAIVQIYVRALPSGGNKAQVSTSGARWPAWGADGSLYFWDTSQRRLLVARTRQRGGQLAVDPPEPVFAAEGSHTPALDRVVVSVTGARYSVHPDGDRFLFLESSTSDDGPPFSQPLLILGWSDRLRRLRG